MNQTNLINSLISQYILPKTNSNNITILLTCTVITNSSINYLQQTESQKRIDTYIKSIKNWLNNTNFNIVVVDNSNYNFNELDYLKKIYKIN